MRIADMKGSNRHRVMSGWTQITKKFSVEVTLYDLGGVPTLEVIWEPHQPSKAEMKRLDPHIDEKLVPLMGKMLILSGALKAGGK